MIFVKELRDVKKPIRFYNWLHAHSDSILMTWWRSYEKKKFLLINTGWIIRINWFRVRHDMSLFLDHSTYFSYVLRLVKREHDVRFWLWVQLFLFIFNRLFRKGICCKIYVLWLCDKFADYSEFIMVLPRYTCLYKLNYIYLLGLFSRVETLKIIFKIELLIKSALVTLIRAVFAHKKFQIWWSCDLILLVFPDLILHLNKFR